MSQLQQKSQLEVIRDRILFVQDQIKTIGILSSQLSAVDVVNAVSNLELMRHQINVIIATTIRAAIANGQPKNTQGNTDEKNTQKDSQENIHGQGADNRALPQESGAEAPKEDRTSQEGERKSEA